MLYIITVKGPGLLRLASKILFLKTQVILLV